MAATYNTSTVMPIREYAKRCEPFPSDEIRHRADWDLAHARGEYLLRLKAKVDRLLGEKTPAVEACPMCGRRAGWAS